MTKMFLASIVSETVHLVDCLLSKPFSECKVAFIPTAADPYEDKSFVEKDLNRLIELGFEVKQVDLKEKTEKQLLKEIAGCDLILVAGGNSFYLLEKALESGFNKAVKKLIEEGVFYAGSSAGTIITAPNIEPIKSLDDPSAASNLKNFEGLSLTDFLPLPHYDNEKYASKMKQIMQEYGSKIKIEPIADKEAIIIDGNKKWKVKAE